MTSVMGLIARHLDAVSLGAILLVFVLFMIKDNRKGQDRLATQFDKMQDGFSDQIKNMQDAFSRELEKLQKHSDMMDEKHAQELQALTQRVMHIENSHMSKDDVYKLISGWKHELERIVDRIDMLGDKLYDRTTKQREH